MKRYLVILEKTETGFSAYSPDVPGCIATGPTRELVESEMRSAIRFHLESLRRDGEPVPEPTTDATYLDVAV